MFDKVLDDLKDCERCLQEIADDKDIDVGLSFMLRSIIYTIQKTQKNIREITDDCVRNDDDDDAFIIY